MFQLIQELGLEVSACLVEPSILYSVKHGVVLCHRVAVRIPSWQLTPAPLNGSSCTVDASRSVVLAVVLSRHFSSRTGATGMLVFLSNTTQLVPTSMFRFFGSPLMQGVLPAMWRDLSRRRRLDGDEDESVHVGLRGLPHPCLCALVVHPSLSISNVACAALASLPSLCRRCELCCLAVRCAWVKAFFSRRFSQRIADALIDPMISGVYAGDPTQLSVKSVFPLLVRLEQEHGSVLLGTIAEAMAVRKAPTACCRVPFWGVCLSTR